MNKQRHEVAQSTSKGRAKKHKTQAQEAEKAPKTKIFLNTKKFFLNAFLDNMHNKQEARKPLNNNYIDEENTKEM